ncbi:TPM domain-containing protein [Paraliomyxa miuraensis]|uniref:TPM domain-containing protein n=1 Tax=Paraliomyxa miuraensis TaxID=376150 RepID=UPI002251F6B2|nr:TPM domain-containing protein [Paraliomyxa miuraensis]MCX4245340.1 TPM domain-containing protein [Paraliomyxa miuraensis]
MLWLWVSPAALARDVPALRGRVTDEAGVLTASEAGRLEQRLGDYEQATGRQFAVLVVASLQGDPIEEFSIRVVEAWRLGREGHDDGLLLLLAVEDHKVRIEVGYGLEGEVTDLISARIIHEVMRPYLRSGRYGQALAAGVEALIEVAGPTTAPPEAPPRSWWTRTLAGHTPLWYGLMALVCLGVVTVCWWRPLIGVLAVLLMWNTWWPASLLGALGLYLRWRWERRRRLRSGYGEVRGLVSRRRPREDVEGSLWRGSGILAVLSMVGSWLTSRSGREGTEGIGLMIAGRAARKFMGKGGGFGGGGASGGW